MTRILAIADVEERALWDDFRPEHLQGADLIVSCGDLSADYLEFLVTMANVPLLYVRGNHDDAYLQHAPEGCACIDGVVTEVCGLRVAGLGGCLRYGQGPLMYTEGEMRRRAHRLDPFVSLRGGLDLLVTHAPAAGVGDLPDRAHRGFACLGDACERWKPQLMLHGHVHRGYTAHFERERRMPCGTKVVNACGRVVLDVEASPRPALTRGATWFIDLYDRARRT